MDYEVNHPDEESFGIERYGLRSNTEYKEMWVIMLCKIK